MAMHNYSNSGLVIAAIKLISFLPESIRPDAERAMVMDTEELEEIFSNHLPKHLIPDFIFVADDDEPNESLKEGEIYAGWDANENPFYVRVLTPAGEALKTMNSLPTFAQWVTFG